MKQKLVLISKIPVTFFKGHRLRRSVCFFIITSIILTPLICYSGQSGAMAVIERLNSTLLASMKGGDELGFPGRFDLLEPVIKKSFALSFMAKKSVGRYWKTLADDQRKRFLKSYIDWSISTYADRFHKYSGERFELLPETKTVRKTIIVSSNLIKADGEKVVFYYKLRKAKDKWFIVDILISGVSQLALTRSQFISVLKTDGFEALISKLQNKIETLSHKKNSKS